MRNVHALVAGAVVLALLLAGCGGGGQAMYVASIHPAKIELPPDIKTVAVTTFAGTTPESKAYADMAAEVVASKLGGCGKFQIAERKNLKDINIELNLGDAGITDPATARKAGQLLNADALVSGTVQVETHKDFVPRSKPKFSTSGVSQETVSVPHYSATVSMTIKMLLLEKGQAIASKPASHSCESDTGGSDSTPLDKAVRTLAMECVKDFCNEITTHVEVFEVQLLKGRSEQAIMGYNLATAGGATELADAAKAFEEASAADPADHISIYDLGVVKMLLGDGPAAKTCFDKAIVLSKGDKTYIDARGKLNKALGTNGGAQLRPASAEEASEYQAAAKINAPKKKGILSILN